MRLILFACIAVPVCAQFDHSGWDRVLKSAVNPAGEVDYAALKASPAALDAYVTQLAASSPVNRKDLFPTRDHELAYWLNAYNALVTKGVVTGFPVKSVRDLGFLWSFFRRADYTVGGAKMSLDDIEHRTIRKQFKEPRIHFAVVCASLSCPKLQRDAFVAAKLDSQLDAAARAFFAEQRALHVDAARGRIRLSSLLKWYGEDFGEVLAFVKSYAPEEKRRAIEAMRSPKIDYFPYDWSINTPGSRAKAKDPWEREAAR